MRRQSVIVVAALAMLAASGREAAAQSCQTCWTNACPELKGLVPACPKAKATPKATAKKSSSPSTTSSCPNGMVHVSAGSFRMGTTEGDDESDSNERPSHKVTLDGYCIDKTEVTVAAYGKCAAAGGCAEAPPTVNVAGFDADKAKLWSQSCNGSRDDRQDHPVNCVSWDQAKAYCTWAGKRLPTEAEWEHAARGSDGRTYPWGNADPTRTRLNASGSESTDLRKELKMRTWQFVVYQTDDGWASTAPVGRYRAGASPYGALDMAGNVSEWVSDWYENYGSEAVTNPVGPDAGKYRVARGSGWHAAFPSEVRAAARRIFDPDARTIYVGFRCVRGD